MRLLPQTNCAVRLDCCSIDVAKHLAFMCMLALTREAVLTPPSPGVCVIRWCELHANGVEWRCAVVLRRQSTIKRDNRIMWYDSMQNAIKQTIIISEILDTRTRHLIQVCLAHLLQHQTACTKVT